MLKKIFVLILLAALLVAVLGLTSFWAMNEQSSNHSTNRDALTTQLEYAGLTNKLSLQHAQLLSLIAQNAGSLANEALNEQIPQQLPQELPQELSQQLVTVDQCTNVISAALKTSLSTDTRAAWQNAQSLLARYRQTLSNMLSTATDRDTALSKITQAHEDYVQIQGVNAVILQSASSGQSFQRNNSQSSLTGNITTLLALVTLTIALLLFLGFIIIKKLKPAVNDTITTIEAMSNGDLTSRIDTSRRDEFGEMARHVNSSMLRLLQTIREFSNSSVVISSTAEELKSSTQYMMSGVEEITLQINSVASASEEMSATSTEIAQNCTQASISSELASQKVEVGDKKVRETILAMEKINDTVVKSAKNVQSLGSRSEQIGGITNIINGIAEQTNLLALNAAIEAARAGDHGRGFAVVSDEVRKLAQNTREATQEIGEAISAMQIEMKQAITSMDEGVNVVSQGTQDAKESGIALQEIREQIDSVTREIQQTATASQQQTDTTDEIAKNMQNISAIMERTSTNVSNNAQAAADMATLALDLKKLIGKFKLVTADEAEKMVKKAYAYITQYGKEKAIAEFNNPNSEFVQGELFVFAMTYDGVLIAYGGNLNMVGKNMYDSKDVKGNYMSRDVINLAKTKGCGWHDYYFKNPHTDKVQLKSTYYQAVDDYYIGCGFYK